MNEIYASEEFLAAWEEIAKVIGTAGSVFSGFSNLISLAIYVLTALAIYTIAQRRGVASPWMAWVPVLRMWTLGAISDHYQRAAHERETKRRNSLIWLNIIQVVLWVVVFAMCGVALLSLLGAGYSNWDDSEAIAGLIGSMGGLVILALVLLGVSIAATVIRYIAQYDLYRSCEPDNAVLFLVLNIFLPITEPILLMVVRSKDDGMPKVSTPMPEPREPWET